MLRRFSLVVALALALASCSTTGEADTIALTTDLADVTTDVNAAVASLFAVVGQPYEDQVLLDQRLTDLRLPTAFAIAIDKTQRVTPPPGTETELDRYSDFLADLLFASEALDLAIATDDPVAAATAVVTIEVAVGALAVALPAKSCPSLTPSIGRDLCDPGTFSGYEDSLSFELRRFASSFRPALRIPEAFGDGVRSRVVGALREDGNAVLAATAGRMATLSPVDPYGQVHEIIAAYFTTLTTTWNDTAPAPTDLDPTDYDTVVAALDADRATTHRELLGAYSGVLTVIPDSKIAKVVDIWFREPRDPPA